MQVSPSTLDACEESAVSAALPEVQDDLDVFWLTDVCIGPSGDRNLPGDEACEPVRIRLCKGLGGQLIVVPVGVDRAEHDGVVEHHVPVEEPWVDGGLGSGGGDSGEAEDPVPGVLLGGLQQHLNVPGAFEDDVCLGGRFAEVTPG